ncbi:hypothetical protein GETHLI_00250 [Geothrix limicola]|uniref:DUF2157 domain-containing protein n=1 Tax=Geothrix limicola TaxID=2927978 RepID=A0ABQ5QAA7_9BACT|nr:hypothetical protein [Geothrix limicola]GLH71523.1 hypothetical protein GETHLI_00250 [Geothrix limicola]
MSRALEAYLAQVGTGLKGLTGRRRATLIRELEAHLRDEAEARGIESESAMAAMLSEKEHPSLLAEELAAGEGQDANHRGGAALAAGMIIGLATGGHMWFEGWRWYIALAFAAAQGLAVGAGYFWVRRHWLRLDPWARTLVALLITSILSIPLGFTTHHGFKPTRLLYGAFTGFLLERHSQERPLWETLLEPIVFTALMFILEAGILGRVRFQWGKVPLELSFNATILLSVMLANRFKRMLAERRVLMPQEQG